MSTTNRNLIDQVSNLIDMVSTNEVVPCDHFAGGAVNNYNDVRATKETCREIVVVYNRMLTNKEADKLCSACRAYWHLQMARNALIEHGRTR